MHPKEEFVGGDSTAKLHRLLAMEKKQVEVMQEKESHTYEVQALTDTPRKNIAENEDRAICRVEGNRSLSAVFDGITTIHVPAFAEKFGRKPGNAGATVAKVVMRDLPLTTDPKDALMAVNRGLGAYPDALSTPDGNAKLLTLGLVVRLNGETLDFAHIGDCMLIVIRPDGSAVQCTNDHMAAFDQVAIGAAKEDAQKLGISLSEVINHPHAHRCLKEIRWLRENENRPDGSTFGVLNGDPEKYITPYIQTGRIIVKPGSIILLLTDGLTPLSVTPNEYPAFFAQQFRGRQRGGLQRLLQSIRQDELADPRCERYPRLKVSDDATGIAIRILRAEDVAKRRHFRQLTEQYRPAMRLLFRGGQLKKKEGWDNVAEHCIAQLTAAEELAELLQLPSEERQRLCRTVAVHDWKKRHERTGTQESVASQSFLSEANPDPDILQATNPAYLEDVIQGHQTLSFLQRLALYLDGMTDESRIVSIEERTAIVAARRPPPLSQLSAEEYWRGIRTLQADTAKDLCQKLAASGHSLENPEDIPAFILSRIERRWKPAP